VRIPPEHKEPVPSPEIIPGKACKYRALVLLAMTIRSPRKCRFVIITKKDRPRANKEIFLG
jgi:hypothetical protein